MATLAEIDRANGAREPAGAKEPKWYMAISARPAYWLSLGDFEISAVPKQKGNIRVVEDTLVKERVHVQFENHMAWLPAKIWLKDKGEVSLREACRSMCEYGDSGQWILALELYELGRSDAQNPRFMRFISAMRNMSKQNNQPFDEGAWVQAASRTKPENMVAQNVVNCRKVD